MSIILHKSTELIGFFLGGLLFALLINELLLHFSRTLGIRNKNDITIRWSNESKPSLGGISLYVVFLFSAIGFSIVYFDNNIFHDPEFLGLLGAASIAFFLGLADDAYNTQPLLKLSGQISCGVLLVLSGTTINLFHVDVLDNILTIVWVVGIMNSLNMLDNMDGITASCVVTILLTCLGAYFILTEVNTNFWSILLISQVGALIGFLKFNIHPSKMFMGDTGSMFIGLFAAFFSIKGLWNVGDHITEIPSWVGLLLVVATFTPNLADTLTVVINRLKKGQSPMIGGKDHTTHHLVYKGLTDLGVWKVFVTIACSGGILSLLIVYLSSINLYISAFAAVIFFGIVFLTLYRNTKKYQAPADNK